MSLNCDNVKDFVSLYKDKCLSDETKNDIYTHLTECGDCRKYYKSYEDSNAEQDSAFAGDDLIFEPNKKYSSLARKLKIQTIVRDILFSAAILASVFITLAVAKNIWKGKDKF